ncbi:MAG: hypothetical protein GY844_13845 [Bradyrhizobium sp.]|nr:hypothetical protein [Bradyrhizobium sp.]
MPTYDDLDSIHPPAFLLADQLEQQEAGNTSDRAAISSRVFRAIALIAGAIAIGAAVLSIEEPMTLLANVTAPLVGSSQPQSETDGTAPAIQLAAETPPPIQSGADVQALPQTANAPGQGEIALTEPANASPSEKTEPESEVLFRKFQAWAADRDAQAQETSAQPVEDTPAPEVKRAARVPHRFVQRQPHASPVRNARAEARPLFPKKRERRAPVARPEPSHTSDARAQVSPVQNEQGPSFLPVFGLRN